MNTGDYNSFTNVSTYFQKIDYNYKLEISYINWWILYIIYIYFYSVCIISI